MHHCSTDVAILAALDWQSLRTHVLPVAIALLAIAALMFVGKIPVGYNLRNLAVRWRTTLLTALAFTLVISLQTVMMAFVAGMNRLTENSGQPGNVIVLSDGATDETFSNLGYSDLSDIERQPGVLRNDQNRPLVSKEVYLVVNQPLEPRPGRPARRFVQVRGIDDPVLSAQVHHLQLFAGGSWFSEAGVQDLPGAAGPSGSGPQAIQAVLGEGVAGQLGKDQGKEQLQVSDRFELGGRKWIVVGVMQSTGSTFGSEIWAKRGLIGPMFGKNTYSSLVVSTSDAPTAAAVATDLSKNFKQAAISAQTESAYFAKLSATNQQFAVAISFVAAVMAIGGVFGVMNTMFAAISSRTKDIGVLRILGFARWQILVSFFIESMLIALVGGLLGCALGYLADGFTATSIVSSGQGGSKFVVLQLLVTADTLLTGILLTLSMGAAGGLIPAFSAMRLKPLESLK